MAGLEQLIEDLGLNSIEEFLQWKDENPNDPIAKQLEEVFEVLREGDSSEN